ncbi:hypothetical protein EVJ58_g4761 [Rhodofomes roseus]|uniref:Uncharacterized protein n=1 Tax=Rhodofomes roseus TaxID=34475 RepID=A0A4Y9YJ97_9APHY|nr:hypothetical protein EVJ58_g4761 [Rhodofomes roseus]
MFRCPYCEQTCTCTACCQKRGETYVPMPRYQIDYETLEPIIRGKPKATPKAAKSKREPRPSPTHAPPRRKSPSPQPLPENHADQLTSGLFWGSVYGIDGARLGGAYINADKQAVVLKPLAALAAVPPRAPKRRVFIGKPDPSWGAGTQGKDVEAGYEPVPPWRRAYIGKRRILAGGWSSESDSEDVDEKFGSDPFDGPLSPVPDEADEDVMDAPPEMPPAHELSFVIAKALFNTSPSPWGNNEV